MPVARTAIGIVAGNAMRRLAACIGILALAFAASCEAGAARSGSEMAVETGHAAGDSILPMDEMIARFQSELPQVHRFGPHAAASRDQLIARFASAVEDSSTEALRALTLSAAEFAWLYFPTSIFAREPYAQPPAVNWLLLEQNSRKGEHRLLRELGGRRLRIQGYQCDEPRIEGDNRIWNSCRLNVRRGDDRLEEMRLFGSIIERDGRFKLMSLANRL